MLTTVRRQPLGVRIVIFVVGWCLVMSIAYGLVRGLGAIGIDTADWVTVTIGFTFGLTWTAPALPLLFE